MSNALEALEAQWAGLCTTSDVDILTIIIDDADRIHREISTLKKDNEARLIALSGRVRGSTCRLPPAEYASICDKQSRIKVFLRSVDENLQRVNRVRKAANANRSAAVMAGAKFSRFHTKNIANDILALAELYERFAGDETRVSSMRTMAARFGTELRELLERNNGDSNE